MRMQAAELSQAPHVQAQMQKLQQSEASAPTSTGEPALELQPPRVQAAERRPGTRGSTVGLAWCGGALVEDREPGQLLRIGRSAS